jgi:hypothetical protein
MRINWPPPSTTFDCVPEKAGFPRRPASFQTHAATDTVFGAQHYCTLTVSLEGFSGGLTVYGMIGTANNQTVWGSDGPRRKLRGHVAGTVHAGARDVRGALVKETATGKRYSERIDLEVK